MRAKVSIVVPAYNNADYIEETMRSLLAQTYPELEIVVSDHSSTDGTWDRLQQYAGDPRVRLLQTAAGGGARANWNRVTEAATGEFVKLVCGDDLITPDSVERQVAAFEPGVVLVASSRDIIDANRRVVVRNRGIGRLTGRHPGSAAIRATVRAGTNVFGEPACVMMRRDSLAAAGNWAEGEQYLIDEATYVSVLMQGDFVGIREPLAAFRVNAGQWSVRLAGEQAHQAIRFHRRLETTTTGIVRRSDVALGNARARFNAVARRLVYAWLGRRMSKAAS
ncbi:glycosyltransferase family 2 protein [Agromyces sp. LHK192]|uniref:glycosyltransferase family 2 protein n=1 Tax=Agromyces sp. LHK192 TaxID=2498704 RepID=UPI000FDADC31|nr:glycosyltransferase family 2 protein [Agromyces sp. LHK192]